MIYTRFDDLPAHAQTEYLRYMMEGIDRGIRNVHARVEVLERAGDFIPYSIKDYTPSDSWIHSLTGQYIDEMRTETKRMKLKGQWFINGLLTLGRLLFRLTGERTITVYPSFMSTTLYEASNFKHVEALTDILSRRFPKHAIIFRTVHLRDIIERLKRAGYQPIVSRAVYLFDSNDQHTKHERKDLKKDLKKFNNSGYQLTHTISEDEFEQLLSLYKQVYLDKYSMHHPHYTADFMRMLYHHVPLKWFILRDGIQMISFMGVVEKEGTLLPAYFGMDQSVKGLYFMTSGLLYQYALDNGLKINNSAGAKDYKLARGSRPTLEYHLLYTRHLPLLPRLCYRLFSAVVNPIGTRALKTLQFK